jgi:hypothetical protein
MKSPIYIEYYSHECADCFKIDLPWSIYANHTIVLCRVRDGYPLAVKNARKVILEAFDNQVEEKVETRK